MLNAYVVKNGEYLNGESLKVLVVTTSREKALEMASEKLKEVSECLEFWSIGNLSCELLIENIDWDCEEEYCSSPRFN